MTAAEHARLAHEYFAQGKRVQAKFHGLAATHRLGYTSSSMRELSADQILDILENAGY